MSHNRTLTATLTTSSNSAVSNNIGYLKTFSGIFKLVQVTLGIVTVGLLGYYTRHYYMTVATQFFFLIAVAFLISSFLLLLSCLVSTLTASIIEKTVFEFIYHGVAFILYLAASFTLIFEVLNKRYANSTYYDELFAAAVTGFVISGIYLLSAFIGYRSCRRI